MIDLYRSKIRRTRWKFRSRFWRVRFSSARKGLIWSLVTFYPRYLRATQRCVLPLTRLSSTVCSWNWSQRTTGRRFKPSLSKKCRTNQTRSNTPIFSKTSTLTSQTYTSHRQLSLSLVLSLPLTMRHRLQRPKTMEKQPRNKIERRHLRRILAARAMNGMCHQLQSSAEDVSKITPRLCRTRLQRIKQKLSK